MNARWIACVVALTAACGNGDGQSLRAGVGILCASDEEAGVAEAHPAERQVAKARWISARLKNREAREAFVRLVELAPADRARVLRELAAKAGLASCAALEQRGFAADLELAEVTGAGARPLDDHPGATVVVTENAIVVEGKEVIALRDGAVDPADRQGGQDGVRLPRLEQFLRATAELIAASHRDPRTPLLVLMHRDTPATLLYDVVTSAKHAGFVTFALGVRRDGEVAAIPLVLPLADDPPEPETSARLVVAVTRSQLTLFSFTGLEGTIQDPRLAIASAPPGAVTRLQETLVEIVTRRPDERRIIAMLDPDLPMRVALPILAAVRARGDGSDLLPDVVLASGFQ
jgi:hypothetical protein